MLKSETRIEALGFCVYVALLIQALVEPERRRAMPRPSCSAGFGGGGRDLLARHPTG